MWLFCAINVAQNSQDSKHIGVCIICKPASQRVMRVNMRAMRVNMRAMQALALVAHV